MENPRQQPRLAHSSTVDLLVCSALGPTAAPLISISIALFDRQSRVQPLFITDGAVTLFTITPYATDIFHTGATEYRPPAMFCIFNGCVPSGSKIFRGAFVAGKILAFVQARRWLENQPSKSGSSKGRMYSYGRNMQRGLILFHRTRRDDSPTARLSSCALRFPQLRF